MAGRGRAVIGREKASAAAGQGACGVPFFSVAPEKDTLGAHKKRAGITYLTYMVVASLATREGSGL